MKHMRLYRPWVSAPGRLPHRRLRRGRQGQDSSRGTPALLLLRRARVQPLAVRGRFFTGQRLQVLAQGPGRVLSSGWAGCPPTSCSTTPSR